MSLILRSLGLTLLLCLSACAAEPARDASPHSQTFTIAVIPDTQNYLDYKHQADEGFALDGSDLFIAQMQDISRREDVAFVASVGDVWQHQTIFCRQYAPRAASRLNKASCLGKPV